MKRLWFRLVLWSKGYCLEHNRWPTHECVETREQLKAYDEGRYIGRYGELTRSLSQVMHGDCPECQVIANEDRQSREARRWERLKEMQRELARIDSTQA